MGEEALQAVLLLTSSIPRKGKFLGSVEKNEGSASQRKEEESDLVSNQRSLSFLPGVEMLEGFKTIGKE